MLLLCENLAYGTYQPQVCTNAVLLQLVRCKADGQSSNPNPGPAPQEHPLLYGIGFCHVQGVCRKTKRHAPSHGRPPSLLLKTRRRPVLSCMISLQCAADAAFV